MKRLTNLCIALVALLSYGLTVVPQAVAQAKPMAVIGLSGINEIVGDVKHIIELAGRGDLGAVIDVSVNGFTQGIDPDRPICIAVSESEGQIKVLGMVPVTDMKKVMAIVTNSVGPANDVGGGVYEINGQQTVYVKEQNGWAYLSDAQGNLTNLPADPQTLLGQGNQDYDIVVRGIVKNIPQPFKDMFTSQIEGAMQQQLNNAETKEERVAQEKMMETQINNIKTMMSDLDELTIGINFDRSKESALFDVTQIALPGTKTATELAKLNNVTTLFSGFQREDAAVNARFVGEVSPEDVENMVEALAPAKEQALKEIEEDSDLPNEEARQLATSLVNKLFEVVEETLRSGKVDGGASLLLDNQHMTLLTGLQVADGKKIEAALDEVIKVGSKEPDFPGVKKNADKVGSVTIHTMSIPVPDHEEEARKFFGETLDLALGISAKSVYFGMGHDSLSQLKTAIQASQSPKKIDTPVHINVAIGPILQFASNFDENPMVAAFAESLKGHAGNDNIVATLKPIPNGAAFRLELQSGILKSVSDVVGAGAAAGAGADF